MTPQSATADPAPRRGRVAGRWKWTNRSSSVSENRAPRKNTGHRINLRVSKEELEELELAAGPDGLSSYVRSRLFRGAIHQRAELRKIAALHKLGLAVRALGARPSVDQWIIAETLGSISGAIRDLAVAIPKTDETADGV